MPVSPLEATSQPEPWTVQTITCTTPAETSTASPPSPSSTASSLPCSSDLTSVPSDNEADADSLCSAYSIHSTTQLWPRLTITYNEAALMKLHRRLQIQTINNISIPLSLKVMRSHQWLTLMMQQKNHQMTPSSDCTLEESPSMTVTDSDPSNPEAESPTETSTTNAQESPMTQYGGTTRGVTSDHQFRTTRGVASNLSSEDKELQTKPTKEWSRSY